MLKSLTPLSALSLSQNASQAHSLPFSHAAGGGDLLFYRPRPLPLLHGHQLLRQRRGCWSDSAGSNARGTGVGCFNTPHPHTHTHTDLSLWGAASNGHCQADAELDGP